jgi:hypothetical protein
MKAKEFIPASKPRNPVVRQQQTSGAGAHRDKKKEQKQGYEKHKGKGVEEGSYTTEKQIKTRIRQIMYDRKLSGTESNAGELNRLKQQLKDIRSQQGVAEGFFSIDDKIKGKIQNIVSDLSDIPGMWDHKAQTFTDAGMDKLKVVLKNNPKYIKYAINLTADDFDESVEEGWGQREFEVDGYTYMTDIDEEEDNRKIWHMLKTPEGKTIDIDFTPYSYMTKDDVELYIKLGMPKRQGVGPLDSEKLQKMAQIKGIAMLDPKMARAGMKQEGRRYPEDWDEGNTEPGNNFAIYINGKKWKVFPGPYGAYADSPEEQREFYRLKDMAARKSQQTGKKWEVYKTGEKATESMEEGWKEKLAAAGLAGAMAFGAAGPAQARVSPDGAGGFTPSAAQMIKATDKADQAKEVVPLSKRYDSRYEGSPEAGVIKVDGKLYKFAGRTADAPGKGEKIKVPAGAVGIRGLGAVTVELDDGKYYQTTPD